MIRTLALIALTIILAAAHGQAPVVGVKNPEKLFTSTDPKLHANKQVVMHIMRDLLEAGHWKDAPKYLTERYIQHNPNVKSGLAPVLAYFSRRPELPIPKDGEWKTQVVSVLAEGDLVMVATARTVQRPDGTGTYTTTWFDMWRIKGGKADEHWDNALLPPMP